DDGHSGGPVGDDEPDCRPCRAHRSGRHKPAEPHALAHCSRSLLEEFGGRLVVDEAAGESLCGDPYEARCHHHEDEHDAATPHAIVSPIGSRLWPGPGPWPAW